MQLMNALPTHYAHMRKPLLHFLAQGLPLQQAADLFNTSITTIRHAKSMTQEQLDASLLFAKQLCTHRVRISDLEKNEFKLFLEQHCKTPSGMKNDTLVRMIPLQDLYSKFIAQRTVTNKQKEELEAANVAISGAIGKEFIRFKGRKTFNRLLKELNVKTLRKYWGWCNCKYCNTAYEPELEAQRIAAGTNTKLLATYQRKVEKLALHKICKVVQREFELELRQELQDESMAGYCMMYMDFAGFEFKLEKCKASSICDLVIVVNWFCDNKWNRKYYDFLCDDETKKNDSKYVRAAFNNLFESRELDSFSTIYLFSDGAGKHVKNQYSVKFFAEAAKQHNVSITWIIFAANHGWSICDSHAGILNQMKHRFEMAGEQPKTTDLFIDAMHKTHLKNTFPQKLTSIDRSVMSGEKLHAIANCFYFKYFATMDKLAVQYKSHANSADVDAKWLYFEQQL